MAQVQLELNLVVFVFHMRNLLFIYTICELNFKTVPKIGLNIEHIMKIELVLLLNIKQDRQQHTSSQYQTANHP